MNIINNVNICKSQFTQSKKHHSCEQIKYERNFIKRTKSICFCFNKDAPTFFNSRAWITYLQESEFKWIKSESCRVNTAATTKSLSTLLQTQDSRPEILKEKFNENFQPKFLSSPSLLFFFFSNFLFYL